MLIRLNSVPLKGSMEIKAVALVRPKIDINITEPHEVQPIPTSPINKPIKPVPASLSKAALLRK